MSKSEIKRIAIQSEGKQRELEALQESHSNADSETYFGARPQIDTTDRHRVFEAAHKFGWQAAQATSHSEIERLEGELAQEKHFHHGAQAAKNRYHDELLDMQGKWDKDRAERDQLQKRVAKLVDALKFYADGSHFIQHQDVWESVSGEPMNFLEDENNTATVEDGSIAKQFLSANQESAERKPQSDCTCYPDEKDADKRQCDECPR